jgi:hypothetical protein
MEQAAQHLTDQNDAEAVGLWISWAKTHVERLNPLDGHLAVPEATEPTSEALKPFWMVGVRTAQAARPEPARRIGDAI